MHFTLLPLTRCFLFIACAMLSYAAQTQKDGLNYWAIKYMPTEFVTPIAPHIRFAVEKRLDVFSINAQLGASIPRTRE